MTNTQLLGSLRTEDGVGSIRVEDVYAASAEDLWGALTDPARLKNWIADVSGDLQVGGTFQATFTSGWEGAGRVDVCEPHQRIVTTMSPGEEGETTVEATLTEEGDRTRLVIEERGLQLDETPGYAAGWQAHIEDLETYLADRPRGDWNSRWNELSGPYNELLEETRATPQANGQPLP